MHGKSHIPPKKTKFIARLRECFRKYKKVALVNAENVSAKQLLYIRHDLNDIAEVVFGKNSLMRKAVKEHLEEDRTWEPLEECLCDGVGLIFTTGAFTVIRDVIQKHCVGSPAKVGAISPVDVIIPPMRTTMAPTQVSILHPLNIQSKIFKGTIEITSEKLLIKKGDKVNASEANLLSILGIMPFEYTLQMVKIFDNGGVYGPEILDISDDTLMSKFSQGLKRVVSLSLGLGYPNKASGPHLIGSAFKDVASLAVGIEYQLKQIEEIQALLSDPEALAKAQAAAAAVAPAQEVNNAAPPPEEEKKEDEDVPMDVDFDFFG